MNRLDPYVYEMLSHNPKSIQVRLLDLEGNFVAEGPVPKAILKRKHYIMRNGLRYAMHKVSGPREPEQVIMVQTDPEYTVKW